MYLYLFSVTLEIIHLMILIGDETEIHFYQMIGYDTRAAKVMIRTRILEDWINCVFGKRKIGNKLCTHWKCLGMLS